jgi:hypothetical protein
MLIGLGVYMLYLRLSSSSAEVNRDR